MCLCLFSFFLVLFDSDGTEFRTFPSQIRRKGISNQLRGLLEVEPLHFTCSSASEATRIENMDAETNQMTNMIEDILFDGPSSTPILQPSTSAASILAASAAAVAAASSSGSGGGGGAGTATGTTTYSNEAIFVNYVATAIKAEGKIVKVSRSLVGSSECGCGMILGYFHIEVMGPTL